MLYQLSYASILPTSLFDIRCSIFAIHRECRIPNFELRSESLSGRRDSNPRPTAWKAVTLPTELLPQDISDARFSICDRIATTHHFKSAIRNRQSKIPLWAGKDSNLRRRMPSDLQSDAFNHFATCPSHCTSRATNFSRRAGGRIRTVDLLITSQLLFHLSYASALSTCA